MTEVQILLMANAALIVVNGMLAWKLSQALRAIRRAQRHRFDDYGLPADHPVRKAAEWESKWASSD